MEPGGDFGKGTGTLWRWVGNVHRTQRGFDGAQVALQGRDAMLEVLRQMPPREPLEFRGVRETPPEALLKHRVGLEPPHGRPLGFFFGRESRRLARVEIDHDLGSPGLLPRAVGPANLMLGARGGSRHRGAKALPKNADQEVALGNLQGPVYLRLGAVAVETRKRIGLPAHDVEVDAQEFADPAIEFIGDDCETVAFGFHIARGGDHDLEQADLFHGRCGKRGVGGCPPRTSFGTVRRVAAGSSAAANPLSSTSRPRLA